MRPYLLLLTLPLLAEKSIQLDPNNARCHIWIANILAGMADKAGTLRQISISRHCKKELETALKLDPPIPTPSASSSSCTSTLPPY